MGFELLTTSFRKILHPTPLEVSVSSLIILVLSILMKMWMAKFNKYLGNKVDSAAMKATATDSLSDCVATSVVLIGVLLTLFSDINIDGIAGVVVAVFVILAGFGAAKIHCSHFLVSHQLKNMYRNFRILFFRIST